MNTTTIQTIRNLSHTEILPCLGIPNSSLILKELKKNVTANALMNSLIHEQLSLLNRRTAKPH
jgi:hypothetical protein